MNSAADVWEKVKTLMEADMTAVSIDTWFGDARAVALEDTRLLLCVSTDFKRDVIRSRFLPVIQKALMELFSFEVDVELLLPEEAEAYQQRERKPISPEDPTEDSSVYDASSPFIITRKTTIKAFAVKDRMESWLKGQEDRDGREGRSRTVQFDFDPMNPF